MATNRIQESRRLLDSVKEKHNGSDELGIRIDELKIGIKETEQAFVRNYPEDSRLLDIGCATGRLCFALARLGYNVTGIDVASKQIDQAKRFAQDENVNVSYLQYEMPTLPFPDASFAAAFMGNVYCYVPHRASRIAFWMRSRVCFIQMARYFFRRLSWIPFWKVTKRFTMTTIANSLLTTRLWKKETDRVGSTTIFALFLR